MRRPTHPKGKKTREGGTGRPMAELLSLRTEDGVLLHGARFQPHEKKEPGALLTHGGWGNFYTGLGRFLPDALAGSRIACLSLNNRGHDYGTVADGEPCIGLLREQFEDSPNDIAAGLRLLKERGYRSAALMRDVWKHYLDIPHEEAFQEAERMVSAGQGEHFVTFRHHGPMPVVSTARTFLPTWGPDPTRDLAKFTHNLTVPLLVTVCEGDWMCMDYSRFVYEHSLGAEPREIIVLPGGNHCYKGAEGALEGAVLAWFQSLGLLEP